MPDTGAGLPPSGLEDEALPGEGGTFAHFARVSLRTVPLSEPWLGL